MINNPHGAVRNALRTGKLSKGPCEQCGTTERVEGHHPDYNEPLKVRWLCATHHKAEHVKLRRLGIKISGKMSANLRLQIAVNSQEVMRIDRLCKKFGNIDRQAIIRIALKKLTDEEIMKEKA